MAGYAQGDLVFPDCKNLPGVPRGLDFGVDLVDGTVRVDQVGSTGDALICPASQLPGSPHAVGLQHVVALVAEQGEAEAVFLYELALFGWLVGTDANDLDAAVFKLMEFVPESLALDGSARGAGSGEEPQDDLTAAEVPKRYRLLIGIRQGEIGGGGAGLQ